MDSRFRGNDNFDRFYHEVRNREEVLYRVTENDTDLAIMGRPPEGLGTEKEAFAYHPPGIIAPEGNREAAPSQRYAERQAGCGAWQGIKNTPITGLSRNNSSVLSRPGFRAHTTQVSLKFPER